MSLRSLCSAGAVVTTGVLAGRVLGLLRELTLASHFGVGNEADVAISLLIIPDFITGALIGSAVGATLVPTYAARGERAAALFWQALLVSVGFFLLLALSIGFGATNMGGVLSGDVVAMPGESLAFAIALCSIPLTAATAITTSYLQYKGRFAVPAFATALFNGSLIAGLWLFPSGLVMLALAIVLAALVRLACHVAAFFRSGGRVSCGMLRPWQIDGALLKTYCTTAATDIFNLFPQFAPFMVIAAMGGGIAVFNYAFKLSMLPAALAFSVTQLVLLPWFVRQLQNGDGNASSQYKVTLQVAWCLSLAICFALMLVARDVAQLCFGYGKMTDDDITQVGQLFAIGSWAMPGMFLTAIWQQVLYAHSKPRMALVASFVQAVAIVPVCWLGKELLGIEGVMAAYTALLMLPVAFLSYAGFRQGLLDRYRPSPAYAYIALATAAAWLPLHFLFGALTLAPWLRVLLAMGAGLVILAAGLAACPPVRKWATHKFQRT